MKANTLMIKRRIALQKGRSKNNHLLGLVFSEQPVGSLGLIKKGCFLIINE